MNTEPEFLTAEEVLQIHDEQLSAYGGATGIRDQGLLESAVAMPQASFGEAYLHEDLPHMYGRSLCLPHSAESTLCGRQQANRACRRARLP